MIKLEIKKRWRNNYFTRKDRKNIKRLKTSIVKMEHYKISKVLKNSTVSNFLTWKWTEVNDLWSGQYSVNKSIRFKTSILI